MADRKALERDIAVTRAQLGETVEALAARLDVKGRAAYKARMTLTQAKATVSANPVAVGAIAAVTLAAAALLFRRARS